MILGTEEGADLYGCEMGVVGLVIGELEGDIALEVVIWYVVTL